MALAEGTKGGNYVPPKKKRRSRPQPQPVQGERGPKAPVDPSPGFTPGFPETDWEPPKSVFDTQEPTPPSYEGGFGSHTEPYGGGVREAILEVMYNNFKPSGVFDDPSIPEGVVFPVVSADRLGDVVEGRLLRARNRRIQAAEEFSIDSRALDKMRQVWQIVGPRYFPGERMPVPVFLRRKDAPKSMSHAAAWINYGPRGHRIINWPRDLSRQIVRGESMPIETLIHEWAHNFQPSLGRNARWPIEGGAESFAQTVSPLVARELGLNAIEFGKMPSYPGAVERVGRKRDREWVLWEQFGGRTIHDADLSHRRARMWEELAALPGASPETQTYARLAAQAAGPQPRTPAPHSLREMERRALGST